MTKCLVTQEVRSMGFDRRFVALRLCRPQLQKRFKRRMQFLWFVVLLRPLTEGRWFLGTVTRQTTGSVEVKRVSVQFMNPVSSQTLVMTNNKRGWGAVVVEQGELCPLLHHLRRRIDHVLLSEPRNDGSTSLPTRNSRLGRNNVSYHVTCLARSDG